MVDVDDTAVQGNWPFDLVELNAQRLTQSKALLSQSMARAEFQKIGPQVDATLSEIIGMHANLSALETLYGDACSKGSIRWIEKYDLFFLQQHRFVHATCEEIDVWLVPLEEHGLMLLHLEQYREIQREESEWLTRYEAYQSGRLSPETDPAAFHKSLLLLVKSHVPSQTWHNEEMSGLFDD